jgi:hypothetical protein
MRGPRHQRQQSHRMPHRSRHHSPAAHCCQMQHLRDRRQTLQAVISLAMLLGAYVFRPQRCGCCSESSGAPRNRDCISPISNVRPTLGVGAGVGADGAAVGVLPWMSGTGVPVGDAAGGGRRGAAGGDAGPGAPVRPKVNWEPPQCRFAKNRSTVNCWPAARPSLVRSKVAFCRRGGESHHSTEFAAWPAALVLPWRNMCSFVWPSAEGVQ